MYMSYCRFEGTHHELRSCLNDVEEHVNGEASYSVSDREIDEFKQMVEDFFVFMRDQEIINKYGELDRTELEKICDEMRKGYAE